MYCNVDIKKMGDMQANNSAAHNLRQIPSKNVNSKKTHLNTFYAGTSSLNFSQDVATRLKAFNVRKNAVKTVNLVFSASPELFKDKEKAKLWEKQTWEFIKNEFGEKNVVYAVVHKDEKTPHWQVSVIPVDPKGKLNASHFFDGRKKCDEFISRYHNAVKNLGLKKSKGKDKASPQSTQEFYRKVKAAEDFDKLVLDKLTQVEKNIEKNSTFGLLSKDKAKMVFKPFYDLLTAFKAKSLQDKEKVKEAEKIKKEYESLKLKMENLGLDKVKFTDAPELKPIFQEAMTALAEKRATKVAPQIPQKVMESPNLSTTPKIKPR